jgi:hypothetical protein
LNPNQMRINNIVVDDVPTHLSPNGSSTHSLFIEELGIRIPLEIDGVISYLSTRLPSDRELDQCQHIELASTSGWDPHSEEFKTQEEQANAERKSYVGFGIYR